MKIVINGCYGGFSLSDEACELFLQKKGLEYFKVSESSITHFYLGTKPLNGKYWSCWDIPRDDPLLLEVVKKLKKKANGLCAELKIINIPDGAKWEIEEYDGIEWVSEQHQRWQ